MLPHFEVVCVWVIFLFGKKSKWSCFRSQTLLNTHKLGTHMHFLWLQDVVQRQETSVRTNEDLKESWRNTGIPGLLTLNYS